MCVFYFFKPKPQLICNDALQSLKGRFLSVKIKETTQTTQLNTLVLYSIAHTIQHSFFNVHIKIKGFFASTHDEKR